MEVRFGVFPISKSTIHRENSKSCFDFLKFDPLKILMKTEQLFMKKFSIETKLECITINYKTDIAQNKQVITIRPV